ncbi:MAG TPA: hypothetical protein VGO80_15570 [Solirubrobacteraceae bacterium]|nr:hypothetical protein [Solirubrobacteraceae bacterium]
MEDALVECELAWGEPDAEPLRRGTVKRWGNVAQTLGADVAGLLRM